MTATEADPTTGSGTSGDGPPTPREVVADVRRRVLGGDRPYVLVFVGALGLAVVIVSGPVRTWAEQRDLVEQRQRELSALVEENAALGDRVEDLEDPAAIEARAREELGMYPRGEVPYVVIPPDVDQPQLPATEGAVEEGDRPGWFERLRQAIADIFGS